MTGTRSACSLCIHTYWGGGRSVADMKRSFLSYRTSQYKLHYYETPTNIKFVMLTDIKSGSMRFALQQIYVNCYVEFVVKNPLSPAEHPGGVGVNNELFEASLEQFVVSTYDEANRSS
jgi:hypothetical protein